MEQNFTLDSDYIDSYNNYKILKSILPNNYSLIKDANVFNMCVHLDQIALKFANCENSRDRVKEAFEELNLSQLKEKVKENCKEYLIKDYSNFKQTFSTNKFNGSIYQKQLKDSYSLEKCIKDQI